MNKATITKGASEHGEVCDGSDGGSWSICNEGAIADTLKFNGRRCSTFAFQIVMTETMLEEASEKWQYIINHNDQAQGGVIVELKLNLIKRLSTRIPMMAFTKSLASEQSRDITFTAFVH